VAGSGPSGLADQEARLREYRGEIRATRRQRDGELAADQQLQRHIAATWKEMKALRTFQNCTNTSLKLTIRM
jgi:hypothetical protein